MTGVGDRDDEEGILLYGRTAFTLGYQNVPAGGRGNNRRDFISSFPFFSLYSLRLFQFLIHRLRNYGRLGVNELCFARHFE